MEGAGLYARGGEGAAGEEAGGEGGHRGGRPFCFWCRKRKLETKSHMDESDDPRKRLHDVDYSHPSLLQTPITNLPTPLLIPICSR